MKTLRSIIYITAILVAGSTINLSAQNREARTSSARAAYGITSEPVKYKTKKKHKAGKNKQTRVSREKSVAYRKRGAWAS